MKKLVFGALCLVLSANVARAVVLGAMVAGAAVLDKAYLAEDRPAGGEAEISRSEALVFRSGGDRIYGQVLSPNVAFGKGRPVVIFCHGFAGFTRMDDVARRFCRGYRRLHAGGGERLTSTQNFD